MISGPAIYKTAVLPMWYLSLVRYCRQLAVSPVHCTIFQYTGIKKLPLYCKVLLHFAKKCAFVVPKYSISFLKCLPFAPFLCQLSFAFHIILKVIAHRDHVIIFDIYTG